MSDEEEPIASPLEDLGVVGIAQACGALDYRIQHRLDVSGGRGDHAQDLACCGLALEALRQISVAGLQLLEEAHVLDGDDRLIGERLEEWKLLGRKCASLLPDEREHTDAGV